MYLIEYDSFAFVGIEKCFWTFHRSSLSRKFAVEVFDLAKSMAKCGFLGAANPRKPNDWMALPFAF